MNGLACSTTEKLFKPTHPVCEESASISVMEQSCNSLSELSGQLHGAITELEGRLDRVMIPPPPADAQKGEGQPNPKRPNFAHYISMSNTNLDSAIGRLRGIMIRLEV